MEYQVLARKWRPLQFEDLVGQEHIARTLKNSIERQRVAHAYLFTGVRGVGKTSTARILAKALDCVQGPTPTPCNSCSHCKEIAAGVFIDVLEIDGASNTGVDDVRDLKENIQYLPSKGHYKIYIIDEVHMLSKAAFNALLKTLEEPPAGVVFIFATTEPNRLPETILSRCQRFDFKRVARKSIVRHLKSIADKEKINISESVLQGVASEAYGSVRDALTLFDRLISYCGQQIPDSQARELLGLIDQASLTRILDAILAGDAAEAVRAVHSVYLAGYDLRRVLESLLTEFRVALLLKVGLTGADIGLAEEEANTTLNRFAELTEVELERYFELTKRALMEIGRVDQEQFLLETAVIKLCRVREDFLTVRDALRFLQGGEMNRNQRRFPNSGPRSEGKTFTQESQKTKAISEGETIDDPYVKSTVGIFGAKVEKIRIRED